MFVVVVLCVTRGVCVLIRVVLVIVVPFWVALFCLCVGVLMFLFVDVCDRSVDCVCVCLFGVVRQCCCMCDVGLWFVGFVCCLSGV